MSKRESCPAPSRVFPVSCHSTSAVSPFLYPTNHIEAGLSHWTLYLSVARSILLVLLLLLVPSKVSAVWPLWWDFNDERSFLGPLATYRGDTTSQSITVRPFLFSYDSDGGGVYHYLYPLGKRSPEKSYFVPIYVSRTSPEEKDATFGLFFYGTSDKGSYGGLFPFYGKLHNRFGKDEMAFFLWPLYGYSEAESAAKTNLLWPFFSVYSGLDKGFKAWPLFGTKSRDGVRDSSFFLWPLFFKESKDLDTNDPIHSFYAFPFYTHSGNRRSSHYNVLFPLFSYSRSEENKKVGFLWNLYSSAEGEENGYSIFPFYSTAQKGKDVTTTMMWPFYRKAEWYAGDERFVESRYLVMSRHSEEQGRSATSIWPFLEYREEQGEKVFFFPSILPLRIPEYDRIVRPLLTLYERREEGDKRAYNLLYGLYTREEEGEHWRQRFAFLLEAKRDKDGFGFELFSGLFGIDGTKIKVLFIPIKRSTGADLP